MNKEFKWQDLESGILQRSELGQRWKKASRDMLVWSTTKNLAEAIDIKCAELADLIINWHWYSQQGLLLLKIYILIQSLEYDISTFADDTKY